MASNPVHFQKSLSFPEFFRHYVSTAHGPRDLVQQDAVTYRKYDLRPS